MGVVELAAAEVRRHTAATIDADCPEIVRRKLLLAIDDRRYAKEVEILEAHRFLHVQASAICEIYTACIHQLLPFFARGIHGGVRVQVLDVIERLHVIPKVHVAKYNCENKSNGKGNCSEHKPGWFPL